MKLKNTLWLLAFACLSVSCSDDLENGTNNGGGVESDGKKAYMTVNISTVSDGAMTKAANTGGAGWGEDGNGFLGELAGKNEAKVHDINVFLVKTTETSLNTDNHLTLFNTADNTTLSASLDGYGYYTLATPVDASTGGNEPNHGSCNITVTMKNELETEPTNFQVFTIVNAGKDLKEDIITLNDLRDYILKGGDNSVIKTSEGDVAAADKFVMSTHKMFGSGTNLPSIVTLSSGNTAENPAQTAVYVERLAARIDLSYPAAQAGQAAGTLSNNNSASPVHEKGTFQLTGYMVVNQWMGGTNMFKQVSPTVDDYTKDIATNATYADSDPKKYLGDEVWQHTTSGQPVGSYNFVWSRSFDDKVSDKIGEDGSWTSQTSTGNDPAYYKNYFSKELNEGDKITTLPTSGSSYTDDSKTFYPIAYVRENTMNTSAQLNGFSTGVIFRTKFAPNDNFKMTKYLSEAKDGKQAGSIIEATLENKATFQFLTAEHYDGSKVVKLVYADVKSVAARAFNIAEGDTKGLLKGFMDGWEGNTNATPDDLRAAVAGMSEKNLLSQEFKQYLNGKLADVTDWAADGVKASLTYSAFVDNQEDTYKTTLKKSLADYDATDIATLAEQYGISFFRDGESYHKFWIRHDDNGDDNKMGVMEFAIVRNNVYQLNVTGVRDLGDPLPFTPGKDDPDNPDESDEVSIDVTIYVKDWVKRTNKNIIL